MNKSKLTALAVALTALYGCGGGGGGEETPQATLPSSQGFPLTGMSKVDAAGAPLPDSAESWVCVRDNVRRLVWEVKTRDDGPRGWRKEYMNLRADAGYSSSYPDAKYGGPDDATGFANAVNAQGLCGARTWRVPTVEEMKTLAVRPQAPVGTFSVVVDETYFPDIPRPDPKCNSTVCAINYLNWTSTSTPGPSGEGWAVGFSQYSGNVTEIVLRVHKYPVRLVRSD